LGHLIDAYIGTHDPHLPLLSPLYGDLHGLPPLLIQEFAERARKAGVEVTLEVWEGMWHVWQMTTPLVASGPSRSQAYRSLCRPASGVLSRVPAGRAVSHAHAEADDLACDASSASLLAEN